MTVTAESLHKAADLEGDAWNARRLRQAAEALKDTRDRLNRLYYCAEPLVNGGDLSALTRFLEAVREERAHREREAGND